MEPKPVITYFGDTEILGTVLQKKFQNRLSQLQVESLSKEETAQYSAFSSMCCGVELLKLSVAQERLKAGLPFYQRPVLHTYWSGCTDAERYRSHDRPLIKQWLEEVSKLGVGPDGHTPAMTLIVYTVTPEVRAKRQRPLAHIGSSSVEEKIRTDYKTQADDIIIFRLASSEESRLVESFNALVFKLNSMALAKIRKAIEVEENIISCQRGIRSDPEHFYKKLFIRKLDLAVAYEMTVRNKEALNLYSEATTDMEEALAMFVDSSTRPKWLEDICNAPCTTWDYPKLAWTQLSWQYLCGIRACSSPLLHTRTFLLVRVAHLLFVLERAWSVSELVISTLHCMAREIKMLKLSFPAGAFDCWAYMTCNEAIQAFLARISPDSLSSATSSLLLVRAELWHYALQKLHDIGVFCGLMPSSNKLNHDKVLIKQISSGITPVPSKSMDTSFMGVEDQGQKLLHILNDRQAFQTEFLTLGEMVIGAFKHAGRRRMAFRVGTMIAQFHRDLGLMVEAEELLSDICKFYSEDQWTELSTRAYSLLADCQLKLKLEEKHINTMLLLASFPPYPAASHDPVKWMESVTRVAQRSPYQKLLNWEPLLELVKIEAIEGHKESYFTDDNIGLDLVIRLHGPKALNLQVVTVQTKLASSLQTLSCSSSGSRTQSPHQLSHGPSPAVSYNSLANLEDLDLDSGTGNFPHSRPIGQTAKFRTTSHVTHMSHAEVTEMEALWSKDDGNKGRLLLAALKVTLKPGENRVRVEGKVSKSGEFAPHKVSLKYGSLDFVYTVDPIKAREHIFTIYDPQINVDIAISPQEGVFLAGFPQRCQLSFVTSGKTTIPDGASVKVLINKELSLDLLDLKSDSKHDTESGTVEHAFTLPAVPCDTSCDLYVNLHVPAVCSVSEAVCESYDHQDQFSAWKHEMELYCYWLTPCYVASLSLIMYEPLGLTCLEHSAEDNCFLQLILENTSPLPLAIRDPLIASDLDLEKLHGNIPKVFHSQENYSLLWRVKPGGLPFNKEKMSSSFGIKFCPLHPDFDESEDDLPGNLSYHPLQFKLMLSDMQRVFKVQGSVGPSKDQAGLLTHHVAILTYYICNTTEPLPQETQFGTTPTSTTPISNQSDYKLGYELCVDKKAWSIQELGCDIIEIPGPGKMYTLQLEVTPTKSGSLLVPGLTLSWVPVNSGKKWLSDKSLGTELTNAQVYNSSHGHTVTVNTSSNIGR